MRFTSIAAILCGMLTLFPMVAPAQAQSINCTCRFQGVSYAIDTCICIDRGDGPQMACCGLVLNNTSWSFTKQACPMVVVPLQERVQSAAYPQSPMPEDLRGNSGRRGQAPH